VYGLTHPVRFLNSMVQQFMKDRTSIVIHDGCKLNNLRRLYMDVVNTSLFTTIIELSYLSQYLRKLS
jgi:hypothetical protein